MVCLAVLVVQLYEGKQAASSGKQQQKDKAEKAKKRVNFEKTYEYMYNRFFPFRLT